MSKIGKSPRVPKIINYYQKDLIREKNWVFSGEKKYDFLFDRKILVER